MSFKRTWIRLAHSDKISTAVILTVIALLLSATQLLQRIDYLLYDIGQQIGASPIPDDVVIVAIDEDSLSKIGRWPWPRARHAELIDKLSQAQARVIALDIVLSEPDASAPNADGKLTQAIKQAGNVVLPVLIESSRLHGQLIETMPLPDFAQHAAALGSVHVVLDEDGMARGIHLREGLGNAAWMHFTHAILKVAHEPVFYAEATSASDIDNTQPYGVQRAAYYKVNFSGPPGHFKQISYAQVLAGEYAADTFKHKIVLVGATAIGMGDALPMPLTGLRQAMPGVEFLANTMQAMRTHQLVSVLPTWIAIFVCILLAILPLAFLPKTQASFGLICCTLLFCAVGLCAAILPRICQVWLPLSPALFAILSAYPIWSWRRLQSASRFLNQQLLALQHDLEAIGETVQAPAQLPNDVFKAQIAQLTKASNILKALQQSRNETLAFISHDVRAPLASLLLQLEEGQVSPEKMKQPLNRALQLVEDFLHISRAEMLNQHHYQPLDMVDMSEQVLDDAYFLAQQKHIQLHRKFPEHPVWVRAEFGLLHRAVLNLVLNSIKFSAPNSEVVLMIDTVATHVKLSVIDYGEGIAADRLPLLFSRFNQAGHHHNTSGSGMGLYFVKTVVEKHQGKVHVESQPGLKTCFEILLPTIAPPAIEVG